MFVFFPYFSRIMGIHFSHVLRTAWISASNEKFQKHLKNLVTINVNIMITQWKEKIKTNITAYVLLL